MLSSYYSYIREALLPYRSTYDCLFRVLNYGWTDNESALARGSSLSVEFELYSVQEAAEPKMVSVKSIQ